MRLPPYNYHYFYLYVLMAIISPFSYIASRIPYPWRKSIAVGLLILSLIAAAIVLLLPHRTAPLSYPSSSATQENTP